MALGVVLLIVIAVCVWKRKQLIPFCSNRCLPVMVDMVKLFLSSFDCAIGKISQQEIIETFAMGLCATMLVWQADTWKGTLCHLQSISISIMT